MQRRPRPPPAAHCFSCPYLFMVPLGNGQGTAAGGGSGVPPLRDERYGTREAVDLLMAKGELLAHGEGRRDGGPPDETATADSLDANGPGVVGAWEGRSADAAARPGARGRARTAADGVSPHAAVAYR